VSTLNQHHWIKHLIKDFEDKPETQIKFHFAMMVFWMVNLAAGTACLILWPSEWVKVGVFYVFALSIYANWATDDGAAIAAQSALHGVDLITRGQAVEAIEAIPPSEDVPPPE